MRERKRGTVVQTYLNYAEYDEFSKIAEREGVENDSQLVKIFVLSGIRACSDKFEPVVKKSWRNPFAAKFLKITEKAKEKEERI